MKIPVELKKRYLRRRISELEGLHQSLAQNDYTMVLKLGHQVKGSADTFDFPQMTQMGVAMELAAKMKDREEVHRLVADMESFVKRASASI